MPQPSDREIEVFNAALELPAKERSAYLDQICAGDATLRHRVEALLEAGDQAGDFLESAAAVRSGPGGTIRPSIFPAEKPGDRIGRYKLLQQIGEGGCGVVYVAEQEEPVRRRVALKVIKLGMDTRSVTPFRRAGAVESLRSWMTDSTRFSDQWIAAVQTMFIRGEEQARRAPNTGALTAPDRL